MLLGLGALIGGMILKGASPAALLNPAALVIIFGGTAAAVLNAFPKKDIVVFPKLFKILFTEKKLLSLSELFDFFVDCATIVRKEGVVGLERKAEEVQNEFLQKGIDMILEGAEPADIEATLEAELESIEERHLGFASIFTQAGSYAPTLGVMGAVMGLLSALSHLDDIEALGHSIAAAFIATLFGIFVGYVICHPFANRLKRKSKEEIKVGMFILKGIICIQEDGTPNAVKRKLKPYLSKDEFLKTEVGIKENEKKEG